MHLSLNSHTSLSHNSVFFFLPGQCTPPTKTWIGLPLSSLKKSSASSNTRQLWRERRVADSDRVLVAVLLLSLATSSGGALDDWTEEAEMQPSSLESFGPYLPKKIRAISTRAPSCAVD